MMINAIVARFTTPFQVDFPDSVVRSVKGAIHFRPGSTVTLTNEEYKYLLDNSPDVAMKLSIVLKEKVEKKDSESEKDKEPKDFVWPVDSAKDESNVKKRSKKRRINVDESEGEKASD